MNTVHFVADNVAYSLGPKNHKIDAGQVEIPMTHYFDYTSYMNFVVGSSVEEGDLEVEVVGLVFQHHSSVCWVDHLGIHHKAVSALHVDHVLLQTCE